MTTDIDDDEIIRQVVERLAEKYPELPSVELERVARTEFDALRDRPVRDYLSILTERAARKRLKKASKVSS
jgi:translation initiation factor 2 alpha subunit (eIF-2alpha)